MSAQPIDLSKYRQKEKGRKTAKTTLYPRSDTWFETWNEMTKQGLMPQTYFNDVLEEAERRMRETLGI